MVAGRLGEAACFFLAQICQFLMLLQPRLASALRLKPERFSCTRGESEAA